MHGLAHQPVAGRVNDRYLTEVQAGSRAKHSRIARVPISVDRGEVRGHDYKGRTSIYGRDFVRAR